MNGKMSGRAYVAPSVVVCNLEVEGLLVGDSANKRRPHPGGEKPQSKKVFFSDDTDCCTDKEIESNSLWGC